MGARTDDLTLVRELANGGIPRGVLLGFAGTFAGAHEQLDWAAALLQRGPHVLVVGLGIVALRRAVVYVLQADRALSRATDADDLGAAAGRVAAHIVLASGAQADGAVTTFATAVLNALDLRVAFGGTQTGGSSAPH